MICQYCKKTLSTKGNLLIHQKTVKYCLKIQEKILEEENDKYLLITKLKVELSEKDEIILEQDEIITKKDEIIQKLKDIEIKNKIIESVLVEKDLIITKIESELNIYKELAKHNQSTVDEMAKQPKQIKSTTNTVINNKVLNMIPFDLENSDFSEAIKNGFTENYLAEGQKGVAQFAYDKLLKNEEGKLNYVCTDPSRSIFKYKSKEGIMERDVNTKKLKEKLISSGICDKSLDISKSYYEDPDKNLFYIQKYMDINNMKGGNSLLFEKEMSVLVS